MFLVDNEELSWGRKMVPQAETRITHNGKQ
jgi:hypothetical protein